MSRHAPLSQEEASQWSPTPTVSKRTPLLQDATIAAQPSSSRAKAVSNSNARGEDDEEDDDGDMVDRARIMQALLSFHTSRFGHACVLVLVAIDVLVVLAELILALLTCRAPTETSEHIEEVLGICSITISSVFMLELLSTLVALGPGYFAQWIHILDAIIIVASFTLDVTARGVAEDIASLLVLGRLWRIVKLAGEATVVDSERMEGLEREIELLRVENGRLRHGTHRDRSTSDLNKRR